jgi:SAM-dependent methyltransferase
MRGMPDGVRTAESNANQLRAWNGTQGDYWTERAERFDEGVANYHGQFLDAAAIQPADTVLDIGCGSGQTTRDAARRASAGSALGVDLSAPMLDLARRLAERERVPNVTFEQADAQVHPFPEARFDVAISRHGAMFFGDPPAAFANIARALRFGGKLVLLTWQSHDDNEWLRTFRGILAGDRKPPMPPPGAPSPWSLSDPDHVQELLTSAGFTDVRHLGLTEPMYFGRDAEDAYQFITGQHAGMVDELAPDERARALDTLRANLAEHETGHGVHYDSAAWLIEATRAR